MLLLFILLSYSQIKLPIFRPILTFFLSFFPCFSFHRKILSDSRSIQGEEERSVSFTNIRRIYKLVFQLLLRPSASFPLLHILRKRRKWQERRERSSPRWFLRFRDILFTFCITTNKRFDKRKRNKKKNKNKTLTRVSVNYCRRRLCMLIYKLCCVYESCQNGKKI